MRGFPRWAAKNRVKSTEEKKTGAKPLKTFGRKIGLIAAIKEIKGLAESREADGCQKRKGKSGQKEEKISSGKFAPPLLRR